MKYQKKPVTIEAWKLDSDLSISKVEEWIQNAWIEGTINYDLDDHTWHISTLEGDMFAENGDYLIQGVHGEIYSCKPDIFEETYVKLTAYDEIANLGRQAIMLNQKQAVDDTDRLSPDDIGNDIHEFLHGGDEL